MHAMARAKLTISNQLTPITLKIIMQYNLKKNGVNVKKNLEKMFEKKF